MSDGNLLALDLGTTVGWACGRPGAVMSGSSNLKEGRFESHGVRFINFLALLSKMHAAMTIDRVVYEEVRMHRGVTAAHIYGGFLSQLQVWCEERKIPYSTRTVQEIKAHATGKGNASKEDVIASVQAMGYSPRDDNEADAIAMFHLEHGIDMLSTA